MFKQSPRRSQRNKGIKVKHVVQICSLIGICIWLLYQVQHSRDAGTSSHENAKISEKIQNGVNYMKLGRKDLQPRMEEDTEDEKQKEDQLEERAHFDDENKSDDNEQEQENTEEGERRERVEGMESGGKEEKGNGGEDKENDDHKTDSDEKETISADGGENVEEKENVEPYVKGDNVENEGGSTKVNGNEERNDEKNDANESNENQSEEANESKDNFSAETTEENEIKSEETKEKESEDARQSSTEDGRSKEKEVTQQKHDSDQEEGKGRNREKRKELVEKNEVKKQKDGSIEKPSLEEAEMHGRTDETNEGSKHKNRKGETVSGDTVQNSQNIAKTKKVSMVNGEEAGSNTKQNEFEDISNNNSELTDGRQIEEPLDSDDSSPTIADVQSTKKTNINDEKSDPNSGTKESLEDSPYNVESGGEDGESKTASPMEKDSESSAANESNNSAENKNSDNDMKTTSFNDVNGTDLGQSRLESSDISDSSSNEEVSPTAAAHDDHVDSSTSLPQEENEAQVDSSTSLSQEEKEAQVDSSTSLPQEEREARTDLDTLPETGTEANNHDAIAK